MSRKHAVGHEPQTHSEVNAAPTGRAARAAARVAARYAHAPSYSQMLAEEARAAIRAAQVAQKAAEDAHAAVQLVLAGLEAASSEEPECVRGLQLASSLATAAGAPAARTDEPAGEAETDPFAEMRLAPLDPVRSARASDVTESEFGAGPLPIPAKLIQFPSEIVATRRLRPRRIEGPLADLESVSPQLSIFEVDPAAISIQPTAPAVNEPLAPAWMTRELAPPEWPMPALNPQPQEAAIEEPAVQKDPACATVDLAPLNRRLLAIVVDGSLTLAAFAGLVKLVAPAAGLLNSLRGAEICAVLALVLLCAGYQVLFANLAKATPGMWYAGIGLCTLEGYVPERRQRCARLLALLLSILPLGMGLAWSLFDENRLTWHDRLSGTYLRLR
jgi:uncharacterized RDD family membrane protein YckC